MLTRQIAIEAIQRIAMKNYEVRVFDEAGRSLIYHRQHEDDRSAIEAAKAFAEDKPFDVWRGMVCKMVEHEFYNLAAQ